MIIHNAQFIRSSSKVGQCPEGGLPEYAFVGRSNVGKSSLINMLMGNKISKVSGQPGKTRLINHFLINDKWYLADLPGYGYAKVSQSVRQTLAQMIWDYVIHRSALTLLFVLLDCRLSPQALDVEFINRLGELGVPFYIIFTKTDKISARQLQHTAGLWRTLLLQTWEELPPMFFSSAAKGSGREEVLRAIAGTQGL
jgi:GTP-binding protein